MGGRLRQRHVAGALALVAVAAALAGCGGGSGGLSSVRSSLPSSLPTVTRTSTTTTTSPPVTTTTTTPTTTASQTQTATATSAPSSGSSTPWGWIAAIAILVVLAVGIAAWAIGRGRAARGSWRAQALQANADGATLNDIALGELIAAGTANRPGAWATVVRSADELSASLHRLEASPPDEAAATAVQGANGALTALRSALAVALSAPEGMPLDEGVRDTIRQRLADLAAALAALRGQAGG
jgi:hypothetical protein